MDGTGLCQSINLKPGVAFSGLTPSMWPPKHSNGTMESSTEDECNGITSSTFYDELGFRVEKSSDEETDSQHSCYTNHRLGYSTVPFQEDESMR